MSNDKAVMRTLAAQMRNDFDIDLGHAMHLLMAYKQGRMGSAIIRYRLIVECGYPEPLIADMLREVNDMPLHPVIRNGRERHGVFARELLEVAVAGSMRAEELVKDHGSLRSTPRGH